MVGDTTWMTEPHLCLRDVVPVLDVFAGAGRAFVMGFEFSEPTHGPGRADRRRTAGDVLTAEPAGSASRSSSRRAPRPLVERPWAAIQDS
jgi:hypothetical protein